MCVAVWACVRGRVRVHRTVKATCPNLLTSSPLFSRTRPEKPLSPPAPEENLSFVQPRSRGVQMRSGPRAKSVEAKPEKARARGEKVLPSPREKRAPGSAGRQAGALAGELPRLRAGIGPSAPIRAAFKQKTSPPEPPAPPARQLPKPARLEFPAPPPSPAPCPAAPLTSAKLPALERGKRGAR